MRIVCWENFRLNQNAPVKQQKFYKKFVGD